MNRRPQPRSLRTTLPLILAAASLRCVADAPDGEGPAAREHLGQAPSPTEAVPGGDTTVALGPSPSMVLPAANLTDEQKARFYSGKALATQPWVRAPTLTDARDGLGPIYNARSCLACHVKGGRGETTIDDAQPLLATLVRISLPGQDIHGGPLPDPVYGTQLQPQSTSLAHQLRGKAGTEHLDNDGPPPEARTRLHWTRSTFTYPDGQVTELRRPEIMVDQLGYGDLHREARLGVRHAPAIAGVGLLDLIPQSSIDRLADPEDVDGDGISGRINQVWDPESQTRRPGRFGLKANQPNVRVQVAAALAGDLGVASPIFPNQPCTSAQVSCLEAPHGIDADGFEISAELLDRMVFFNMSIGVPTRRKPDDPEVERGRELFHEVSCAACHAPHFRTGTDAAYPHLSNQDIWPYTDLLLHDMGEALADGRGDFLATGAEWRTAPLWGAGLARAMHEQVGFLHDGRARTVEEAVLWHGGEAEQSRASFAALTGPDRRALLAFVRSL